MHVRLIGITPKKRPRPSENGRYRLSTRSCPDGRSLLGAFGLTPSGLSILRNGRHVSPAEKLDDGDDIQIFIKNLGG